MAKQLPNENISEQHDVVIVGGGPVGLFLGLNLAQKGLDIVVLDAEADIIQSPRALMYVPKSPKTIISRESLVPVRLSHSGIFQLFLMNSKRSVS